MLEWQILFNVAGGLATLVVSGYVRFVQAQLANELNKREILEGKLADFQLKVAEKYVTHDDIRRIEEALIRIEAKFDVVKATVK